MSKKREIVTEGEFLDEANAREYFYEVDIYRLYKDRVEIISNKFFKTLSPYSGDTCIVRKLNKDVNIMKTITEIQL